MTRKPLALALALALAWVSAADDQVHAPVRNRRKAMEADTVKALRDAKSLFDEGILSEQEFKEQKAELLQPKATVAAAAPCGFRAFFERNAAGPGIHKWLHYFSAYEQEFSRHCGAGGAPAKMIEIGIQSGGSMRMWRERFGQNLEVLVGVDIQPNTKAWERFGDEPGSRPGNVHVEIGSQADPAVFDRINAKYPGGFDIVLDDGSHAAAHILATFQIAWKLLRPGGVYFIEDITKENRRAVHDIILSASHPHEGGVRKGSTVLDALYDNKEGACCKITPNSVQHEVEYVKMYPMILAIKKRETPLDGGALQAQKRGDKWIPY